MVVSAVAPPHRTPPSPPPLEQLLPQTGNINLLFSQGPLVKGRYLHWDELRHRNPPNGLSHKEWWAGVKIARYGRAYLHTETDDNDTTYFIIHQLTVIDRAIHALYDYLKRKTAEQRSVEALLRHAPVLSDQLNHRQVALLSHALRHAGHGYTVESHRRSHNITHQTSRTDLLHLAGLGLMTRGKRGRAFVFYATKDLRSRIEAAAKNARRTS